MTTNPSLQDDFPVLTEVVAAPSDDLPLLSEIAQTIPPQSLVPSPLDSLPSIQQALETYIETVWTEKLKAHCAVAQQWAIEKAIAELKNELPQLIREAQDRVAKD